MTHESASSDLENGSLRFSDLDISPELKQGIKELGYVQPTDFQKGVFENFQNGRNIIGEGQSSYGKSLAFALPILTKIDVEQPNPQALIICESAMLADHALKESRALSRHIGMSVSSTKNSDGSFPHLLVVSVDDLAKLNIADVTSLRTIFFDGLSAKNATRALSLVQSVLVHDVQILIFGEATLAAFKESNQDVIDTAAIISNTDQPKTTTPAKHIYVQAKEAEPKPRALLGALEILKPSFALVTCNESQECELLSRYLSRYGYKTTVVSEDANRHGLADALSEASGFNVVICQNSLLVDASLEKIPFMFNYDMFDRPQAYEHSTQFAKQASGLTRSIVNILSSRELGLLGPIKAQCLIDFSQLVLPTEDEIMALCASRIRDALLKEASEVELTQFEVIGKMIFDDPQAEPIRSLLLRNYLLRAAKPAVTRERRDDRDNRDDRRGGRGTYDRRRGNDRGERNDRGDRNERGERTDRSDRRDDRRERPADRSEPNGDREIPTEHDRNTSAHAAPTEGITRLYVTLGRKDGLFDLASLAQYLSDKSGVDLGHFSGSGMIRDTSAHIEVDDDVAEEIIASLHNSARPQAGEGEENPIVCERARQSVQRHNRRPPPRRRHFSRRP